MWHHTIFPVSEPEFIDAPIEIPYLVVAIITFVVGCVSVLLYIIDKPFIKEEKRTQGEDTERFLESLTLDIE